MWRQEDAHEYMRCLLEALLKCSLPSLNASSAAQQEKSFVFRIFGGRLRSQVMFVTRVLTISVVSTLFF